MLCIITIIYLFILAIVGFLINKFLIKSLNKTCRSFGFFAWGILISVSYPLTINSVFNVEKFKNCKNTNFWENIDGELWFFYGSISFVCIFIAGLVFAELSRTPEIILMENEDKDSKEKDRTFTKEEIKKLNISLKTIVNILQKKK